MGEPHMDRLLPRWANGLTETTGKPMRWRNLLRSLTNPFYRHPGLPVHTSRLLLRNFVAADHASVHRYAVDPEVTQYTDWGPTREVDTKVFLAQALAAQRRRPRKQFDLAVVLKQDGGLIGACGLHVTQPRRNEGYLGYWLGRPFWGNGYATEALAGLLTLGFHELELHRIFAYCCPENGSSIRCLEKVGMRQEGRLRQHTWKHGLWQDMFLYAILADEWRRAGR
jgi:ribosomal-protein-alanine N-acetyltransferase